MLALSILPSDDSEAASVASRTIKAGARCACPVSLN